MPSTVYNYTLKQEDLFETILHDKNIMLNHVIIESGKIFSKHPTDAHVYIIVIKGILSITLENETIKTYTKGDVIEITKGAESVLGNTSDDFTEVFVIKVDKD